MSTAIGEKRLSTMRAEQDARQPARQSKAHPDCRSATIKSRFTKISLALSPGRDNHRPAATAKMAILIVAVFPSRLSRYSRRLRSLDQGFLADNAHDCGRSQAPGRQDRLHLGTPHLGLRDEPSSTPPHD